MAIEWYRQKAWTPENREEFFKRLGRSRDPYHKAQYAVIQGETLGESKKRETLLAAIELLEMALTKWPEDVQTVRAQFALAECYVKLADLPRAVEAFRQVVETQKREPGFLTTGAMTATKHKAEARKFANAALTETTFSRAGFPKSARFGHKVSFEQLQKTLQKLAGGQPKSAAKATGGRKMEHEDQALSELGQMFASPELVADDPTPGSKLLKAGKLDFTLESLGFVDDYLDKMRKRKLAEDGDDYIRLVLRCGAYVGEVIVRNAARKEFHWLDYKAAVKISKSIADFGESVGSAAVLWDGKSGMWFPLAKVQKFLDNGREDSVKFFAEVVRSK